MHIDDIVQLSQQQRATRRHIARTTLFESIDEVLRPLAATDKPCRKEPNSTKKLEKGDGAWATQKIFLGWLLDTVCQTIELPLHWIECLQDLLAAIPSHQRFTSRQK